MAATIRKADYYSMRVPNRAGTGAKILAALKADGVNLLAFTGFPVRGGAQVDFIPENTKKLRASAKKHEAKLGKRKTVFLMRGDDRVGALTAVIGKLAASRINVVAMQAVIAGGGRYGAMFWVKPKDLGRASRLLGAK